MKRDIVLGIIAGLVAFEALRWSRAQTPPVPPGIYQGALDEAKHRDMLRALDPPNVASRETRKKLDTKIATFEVDGRRLDWVIAYLADVAGVDIDVDWVALANQASPDQPVVVALHDVTVARALRAVLDLDRPSVLIQVEAARVWVTSPERAYRDAVTRVYDVRDMVNAIAEGNFMFARHDRATPDRPPFLSHRRVLAPGTVDFADFVNNRADAIETISRHIMESVDFASWRDAGGSVGSIRVINGRLVVTQTRANQDDVAVLLEWMRAGFLK